MMKHKSLFTAVIVMIVAWVVVVVSSGAGWNPFDVKWDFTHSGAFGDSFGPLSAAMSGAAAIGAFLAWSEQRAEIARSKIKDEKAEHDLSIARDDQTFFNLLQAFREVVALTDIQRSEGSDKRGHDAFASILKRVLLRLQAGPAAAYKSTFDHFVNDLGHYFRLLYNIIAFVDRSNLPDKYFYVKTMRALLSDSELALVGLNCAFGEGQAKFKPLVERYSFLKNLSVDMREKLQLDREFASSAFSRL